MTAFPFLTDLQLAQFAQRLAPHLKNALLPALSAASTDAQLPRRMSVPEFAACVRHCHEVVRRDIRARFISPEHVEGGKGKGYFIDRVALERYGVSLEVAAQRLSEFRSVEPATP